MQRNTHKKKPLKRKPSATTRVAAKKSSGGLIYLMTGLVIGLFIAFLVYLEEQPEDNSKNLSHPATNKTSNKQTQQKLTSKKANNKNKPVPKPAPQVPKYEFYTMLPDVEVEVNVPDIVQKKQVIKAQAQAQAKKNPDTAKVQKPRKSVPISSKKTLYQLQVGAFAAKNKAESMKGQLGFMGMQSSVSSSLLSNGKKVYKVRIGPSSNEKKLQLIKGELKRMHINAFLQKL